MNPFLLAHGSSAGPLMRPLLTGALSGCCSSALIYLLLSQFHLMSAFSDRFGKLEVFLLSLLFGVVMGFIYGWIYRRAANDRRGGWIFGASTGYIFWMINPVIWWPWMGHGPLLVGWEALAFLISHVLYGFVLGLIFPWVHRFTSSPLEFLDTRKKFRSAASPKPGKTSILSPSFEDSRLTQVRLP